MNDRVAEIKEQLSELAEKSRLARVEIESIAHPDPPSDPAFRRLLRLEDGVLKGPGAQVIEQQFPNYARGLAEFKARNTDLKKELDRLDGEAKRLEEELSRLSFPYETRRARARMMLIKTGCGRGAKLKRISSAAGLASKAFSELTLEELHRALSVHMGPAFDRWLEDEPSDEELEELYDLQGDIEEFARCRDLVRSRGVRGPGFIRAVLAERSSRSAARALIEE